MYDKGDGTSRHVTATDVARRLGVSQTTVSRILNGAPGHRYAAETCRRVQEEAERLGYRPHAVGRSLRERRTRVIGFYCIWHLDARNAFLAEIIGGLQQACYDTGQSLLLQTFPEGTPVQTVIGELTCGRMDGVILHTTPDNPIVAGLNRLHFPAVAVTDALPELPSVVCDDHQGVRLALSHLRERGHERIAFARPRIPIASVSERVAAYYQVLSEQGQEPVLLTTDYEETTPVLSLIREHPVRPTAVFCWNDLTALHLLHTCREQGIEVPEDLAIVGFDDIFDTRITAKVLTTVHAGWSEVAETALAVLLRCIAGETVPLQTLVPVSLRIGETT